MMKAIYAVLFLFFMCFMVSCSTIYGVQYDYNQQTDFSKFKTYDWLPIPVKADIDSLNVARVKKAVNDDLQAKGITMASGNPDFLIAAHFGHKEKIQVTNWGYGYGPYGSYWGGYWGPGGVSTYQYQEGYLILDFVDAKTKNLIWRGTAKAEVDNVNTPEKKVKLINEAVEKILEKFPPQK